MIAACHDVQSIRMGLSRLNALNRTSLGLLERTHSCLGPVKSFLAGTYTSPKCGTPERTKAMLTVNSPVCLMNSLVPSMGSTTQRVSQERRCRMSVSLDSSESTGMALSKSRNPSTMTRCAARSASVKGLSSAFFRGDGLAVKRQDAFTCSLGDGLE